MLSLWRRHLKKCPHKDIYYRRCQCPVWAMGAFQGTFIRKSLDTRSWERGTQIIREWEDSSNVETTTLDTAAAKFIDDATSRHLSADVLRKYRLMFKELSGYLGNKEVKHISLDDLSAFRSSWKVAPATSLKKLERLRTFFKFCEDRKWIEGNPAKLLKTPKVSVAPTLPFTESELEKIMWAIELCPNPEKMKAFVLTLRYTGLRIKDAVMLSRENVDDGKIRLKQQKTKLHVYIPIPHELGAALENISRGEYFFWTGESNPNSCVGNWQRRLQKLFINAGIKNGHAHRFRDTFSTDLLSKGVPIETVSILLGHSSIRITEKHYAPYVKSRQENLETQIKKIWSSGKEW